MEELLQKMPPFAWIEQTTTERVTEDIKKVNSLNGWPLVSIKDLPEETVLNSWIEQKAYFHVAPNLLTDEELATLLNLAQDHVFFEGWRLSQHREWLVKGGSVIIHNRDNDIGNDGIVSLCLNKPAGRKIWLDSRGFTAPQIRNLLSRGMKMVFSKNNLHSFAEERMLEFIAVGQKNAIIHASAYPEMVLKRFLNMGATLLFLGDTEFVAPHLIPTMYNGASDEAKTRIRVMLRNGEATIMDELVRNVEGVSTIVGADEEDAFLFS